LRRLLAELFQCRELLVKAALAGHAT
jgi:hypothetical protein